MMVFSIASFMAESCEAYGEGAETMIVRTHYLGSTLDAQGVRQASIEYEALLYSSVHLEPDWYACFSDAETERFQETMVEKGYALEEAIWYPIRETIKPYRRR